MKILIKQFLGQNHSWSVCGWGLARAFKKAGHSVHLFSTDGVENLPPDLKENLIGYANLNQHTIAHGNYPDKDYDMQVSYTAMKNFPHYLSNGFKNRFGIWTYEWNGENVLPTGFAKNHMSCDMILAPSEFSKDIFINSKVPENKIHVIPHGIDEQQYSQDFKIKIPTNKKFKILANIAQNHIRKNIPGMLEAYGKAFSKNDDVCLLIKAKPRKPMHAFDIDLNECISQFKKNFPNHAEIKIISEFIFDMSALYRSVDCTYTLSFCEGFYFPALEALASGKLNIAPAYGGHLDYLNQDNSILVNGSVMRADPKSMYWESKNNAVWFEPCINDASEKLRHAYSSFQNINSKLEIEKNHIIKKYGWDSIGNKILQLTT